MAGMTLDDIRKAADDRYGPYIITGIPGGDVTLLNALRLSKDKREQLTNMQNADDGEDQEERLHEMVRLIADTPASAQRLLKEIGGDLAALAVVLNEYGEAARLGKPSPSAT